MAINLRDIDQLAGSMLGDDVASPARRRMRQFMQRSPRGVMPSAIVNLLEAEKMPVTRPVRRWLREDEAAGLVEPAGKFGMWKWRGGL